LFDAEDLSIFKEESAAAAILYISSPECGLVSPAAGKTA
jgi:hypothetical protein